MNFEIKIAKGNTVFELLNDKNFITKWKELAKLSNKVTVMQEPAFVITWYKFYSNIFKPILVLAYNNKTELVGLMPLSSENNSIVHAGAMQAEYHGWLCKEEFDEDFPIKALIAIKQNFILRKWLWGWIPPKSNINWLNSSALKKEKIYIKYKVQDSPILDLNDGEKIEKLKKNRSLRNKINRYKKRGDFLIQRITTKKDAENVFDRLEKQCDFRKLTLGHVPTFASDPQKKQFIIEKLAYPENNHFTVLWSNNKPIAFHIGECDLDTVYLTLMSHDAIEAKNSPGKILLIKLAELLKDEGYRYFDLTPGGDQYKQMFSNTNRKVFYPVIFFNKKDKVISDFKDSFKKTIKEGIVKVGMQPTAIANKLSNISTSLQRIIKTPPKNILRKFISSIYSISTDVYYKISTEDMLTETFEYNTSIKVNNYSDFLLEINDHQWDGKSNLFSQAQRRFNSGDLLFTKVIDGVLAQSGWMTKKVSTQVNPRDIKELTIPENCMFLYDFVTHPSHNKQELLKQMLCRMVIDSQDHEELFIGANENNTYLRNTIENIGFKIHSKIKKNIIFGFVFNNYIHQEK